MRLFDRRASLKSVPVFAIAAIMLSAGVAKAEIKTTTIAQSTFVIRCMAQGGTVEQGGTAAISVCKLPNGQTVACDFSTSPAYCDTWRPNLPFGDLLGGNADTVKQGSTKGGPKVDTAPSRVN